MVHKQEFADIAGLQAMSDEEYAAYAANIAAFCDALMSLHNAKGECEV